MPTDPSHPVTFGRMAPGVFVTDLPRSIDFYCGGVERGVRIVKALRDADFGLRTFVFADPDGNRIDVGNRCRSGDLGHDPNRSRIRRLVTAVHDLRWRLRCTSAEPGRSARVCSSRWWACCSSPLSRQAWS
ncbi:MAG: hypothetical protein ACRD0H_13465 [Actinomycetes bacterium]